MCLEVFLTILTTVIAFIAVIIAFISARYQLLILIITQLTDKARECNSYLMENRMKIDWSIGSNVSGFISSIITANQLLDYNFKKHRFLLVCSKKQYCIDQFYLQLHTSIRLYVGKEKEKYKTHVGAFNNKILNQQFKDVCEFLKISVNDFQ